MEKGDIMDAVKCEAFLTAVDRGSFTAAAETLGYTQSGITRMINALESELGFPLFVRQKKGVVLTENGKTMLPAIRTGYSGGCKRNSDHWKLFQCFFHVDAPYS